ncbi:low-density lipoprotein receptor-related protein 1B-like [Penaeus chinensis]|uniref:low-density lipoprotein receptor-related protein 1B-like n=1 Tax=Penaeus chinensis TaxID=139456 RepID=UPI001FB783CF|nr:low-density lipoprotein receptor-related protein 1B-like [Penaeus chinensis]
MANPVKLLLLALVLLTALTDGAVLKKKNERASNCNSGYHECINGNCIPNMWVCDGYADCSQGEDEINCGSLTTWGPTESSSTTCTGFVCNNGDCISESQVCNGYVNCPWGEDENLCDFSSTRCEFSCWNGQCIPGSWVCDGYDDCPEGEDEYCASSNSPASPSTDYTDYPLTTPYPPAECHTPFDAVGGKCILVDIFESVTWAEARYLCEKFGADLVTLESMNFYTELLDFLNEKGLAEHDYWVGANDTETEGEWAWLNGTPVRMGTPLWALYRSSSNDYEQEPTSSGSDSGDCAFMDKSRFLYLDDGECGSAKAAICQQSENLSHYLRRNLDAVTDTPSLRNPASAHGDPKDS